MKYRIEQMPERKVVGMHLSMSLAENKTAELWRRFMPRKNEIHSLAHADLISLQCYPEAYFFEPQHVFVKWACREVSSFQHIPAGMEKFVVPAGLYAVFLYKGHPQQGEQAFRFIFSEWLPNSQYKLDNRPHFEILGEKYNNTSEDSEEEIWIPITTKQS